MVVSALPSHFVRRAFVLHYDISLAQSTDGAHAIFQLLYTFWHNRTENFER